MVISRGSSPCGLRKLFCSLFKTGSIASHRRRSGSWRSTQRIRMTFKPSVDPIPENYAFDDGSDSDSDLDSVSISESPTVPLEDEGEKLD